MGFIDTRKKWPDESNLEKAIKIQNRTLRPQVKGWGSPGRWRSPQAFTLRWGSTMCVLSHSDS